MAEEHGVTGVRQEPLPRVRVDEERGANLLCYFLASVLARSMRRNAAGEIPDYFTKGVKVTAGGMTAYISRMPDGLLVSRSGGESSGISVEGDLGILLSILTGKGAVLPFLRGDLRVGGNLLTALKLLGFLKGAAGSGHSKEPRHG